MLLLWIMVGLTVVVLLILNILLLKKNRSERQHRAREISADKEAAFQKNCEKYHLSAREIEVLRLILTGHTYRSAAGILFISEKTVDAHLRSIYSKSSVKNKVELVVRFYS
jgi:DNA-binding CsgD family transcriptional regulator